MGAIPNATITVRSTKIYVHKSLGLCLPCGKNVMVSYHLSLVSYRGQDKSMPCLTMTEERARAGMASGTGGRTHDNSKIKTTMVAKMMLVGVWWATSWRLCGHSVRDRSSCWAREWRSFHSLLALLRPGRINEASKFTPKIQDIPEVWDENLQDHSP